MGRVSPSFLWELSSGRILYASGEDPWIDPSSVYTDSPDHEPLFCFLSLSFSSAPWDYLRNKLSVHKFLSQIMLLGEIQVKETFLFYQHLEHYSHMLSSNLSGNILW